MKILLNQFSPKILSDNYGRFWYIYGNSDYFIERNSSPSIWAANKIVSVSFIINLMCAPGYTNRLSKWTIRITNSKKLTSSELKIGMHRVAEGVDPNKMNCIYFTFVHCARATGTLSKILYRSISFFAARLLFALSVRHKKCTSNVWHLTQAVYI